MVDYRAPSSLKEALEIAFQGARVVAGATDLSIELRRLRLRGMIPEWPLLDITRIPELQNIDLQSERPFIGSAVTIARLETDAGIAGLAPMITLAARTFGSRQVRSLATIGGNVANASPAADCLSVLTALDATAEIASLSGKRESSLQDLVTGPNSASLAQGEIITGFYLDNLPPRPGQFFYKIGRRRALVIARVNVALSLDKDMADPRVVVGACFPSPRRLKDVEDLLKSGRPGQRLWNEAGKMAARTFCEVCGWRSSFSYKVPAVTNVLAGSLKAIWDRRGGH
jgi:CO/xanthine dehydrogenase FAD-binding subunit